jgi:SAM-dependent methyltransferase
MKEYSVSVKYYDILYDGEYVGDEEFWQTIATGCKGPILELGSGTGRVTFLLAKLGYEVTGIDSSEVMLARARGKLATQPPEVKARVLLNKGDMTEFAFENRFGLIIIPFRAFQHLLTPERQAACLNCVRKHLLEGGKFVVTMFNPDLHLIVRNEDRYLVWESERVELETGSTIIRSVRNRYDTAEQVVRGLFIYQKIDKDGTLVSTEYEPFALRWTWRWEMEYLLRLSGFRVDAVYGNYHRVPHPEATKELIFVCS